MNAEPQAQPLYSCRRSLPAALAFLALLLAHGAAPARADHHPPTVEPDSYCGFTGVKNIDLAPGDLLPLPERYENLSSLPWKFYIFEFSGQPFLPAEYMGEILKGPLALKPGASRTLRGFGYRLPFSTPPGTYFVDHMVMANYVGGGVSRTLYVARCQYNLRVISFLALKGDKPGAPGRGPAPHRPSGR